MNATITATEPGEVRTGKDGVEYIFETCLRCGGTGHFSYNPMDGTICFGCRGHRGQWVEKADHDRRAANRVKAAAARERKAARFAAALPGKIVALVAAHPLLAELLYRVDTTDHTAYAGILGDLLRTLESKGALSVKQIELAERLIREDYEEQAKTEAVDAERAAEVAAALPVPTGRIEVEGEVLTVKDYENEHNPRGGLIFKMLVLGDDGWKVWGTVPRSISPDRGDRVKFTATVKPKEGDETFGYYSRPSKAEVLVK
jgi:hypothetical protein